MRGRPGREDAAPYYFTYIDQVPDGDIVAFLDAQGRELAAVLAALSDAWSGQRPRPDAWSGREVLGHVIDAERLFTARAFWFARGLTGPLPSFDQEVCAAAADADARPWGELRDEFAAQRAATVTFFAGLPAAAWERRGVASDAPFTVRALAYLTAGHAAHHLRRFGRPL